MTRTHKKNQFDNAYIISGTMGSGKSTVMSLLNHQQYTTIEEPARPILSEQRLIAAEGTPEQNADLFTRLLLSRSMYTYRLNQHEKNNVLFDRGIPDVIAYAKLFQLDTSIYDRAAQLMRYNPSVFYLPSWPAIYKQDEERKMTLKEATKFDGLLREIYKSLGYQLIEVPLISPEERAQFIMEKLRSAE